MDPEESYDEGFELGQATADWIIDYPLAALAIIVLVVFTVIIPAYWEIRRRRRLG